MIHKPSPEESRRHLEEGAAHAAPMPERRIRATGGFAHA
jgi:hypothetical protein